MADKFDERWREKLPVPEPERQIGETADGKPIFVDLRELIASPSEEDQRWSTTLDNRRAALVEKCAQLVLKNAALFIEHTFWRTANRTGQRLYESGNAQAAFAWASANGYEAIQDGLKTVVKHNGKVIRDMHANISQSLAPLVSKRVMELVKQIPNPK